MTTFDTIRSRLHAAAERVEEADDRIRDIERQMHDLSSKLDHERDVRRDWLRRAATLRASVSPHDDLAFVRAFHFAFDVDIDDYADDIERVRVLRESRSQGGK